MYTLVLSLHSWLRWAALAFGLAASYFAFTARDVSRSGTADRWGLFFMIALDVQMLLGLLLYFSLSPLTSEALQDLGAAMRSPSLRFWAVEHVSMMLAAVVLVHVGRVLARRAPTQQSKRIRRTVCFGLAALAMIAATPWPGTAEGRPLFRL